MLSAFFPLSSPLIKMHFKWAGNEFTLDCIEKCPSIGKLSSIQNISYVKAFL